MNNITSVVEITEPGIIKKILKEINTKATEKAKVRNQRALNLLRKARRY